MYNLRKNAKPTKKSSKNNVKAKHNTESIDEMSFVTAKPQSGRSAPVLNTVIPGQRSVCEGLQNSLFSSVCNMNPESPFKLVNVMDKRFEKLTEQIEKVIESKLNKYKIEILAELDKRFTKLQNELDTVTARVTQLENVAVEFKSMQEEIMSLRTKIKHHENSKVASELRLNDIPYYENENLMDIFSNICNTIKITVPSIKSIYRLHTMNNKRTANISKDSVIIVELRSAYDKNFFFKTLANFKKANRGFQFCLKHIGLNSEKKFYINENLTKDNFMLFRAAARLKKRRIIHSAFTMRGFVYIRKTVNDTTQRIDDLNQLHVLSPDIANDPAAHPNSAEHFNNLFRAPDRSLSAAAIA